jgi:hypothetical protein
MFDLMTSTGVLFGYEARIPDRSKMQMVEFTVTSPFTNDAGVLMMNVATLAVLGKSVEQTLVEHVEHYERIAIRRASDES